MTPLRQRMLEDMRIRNLSPHTQRAYVENVARFARHFGRSPADLGPEEIRTYQVYLVEDRHLTRSSIEIAVCALRFLLHLAHAAHTQQGDDFKGPRRVPGVKSIADAGLSTRCEVVGGDFFKSIPSNGDAYLMASILHDWDDDRSIAILKTCRQAAPKTAKLLLVEMVIPPGDAPFFGKILDLNMLVVLGGRERTEAEYRDLLSAGGFRLDRIVPTPSLTSVVEAVPA